MTWPKARAAGRVWGLLAGLGLIAPCLFSAQVFKYPKIKPDKGYLIQTVPFEKWLARNYCGPACLAMVLNYWDETRSFSQRKITEEIYDLRARRRSTPSWSSIREPRDSRATLSRATCRS